MEKVYYGKLTEDDVLVESLGELCGDPTWRADNGDFKDGYLVQLETMMETKIPGCQIKATAIESRINSLKKKYFAITDMKTLAGVGWDEDRMMIIGDESVYDGWVKIDKNAKGLYRKPFLFYYSLEEIYGKFLPTGSNVGNADVSKKCYEPDVEDDALVESLQELSQDLNWRAYGGFKNGYIVQLQTMLENKLPGCQIKEARVECRVNFLRKKYFAIGRMRSLGKFGWDNEQMMLKGGCKYDNWGKISKRERKLFDKPFRHYYALKRIYGKDRASDEDSGASGNAYNNVKTQEEIPGTNLGTTVKIEPQFEGHNIPFGQHQTLQRRAFSEISATVPDCGRRVRNRVMEDNQPEKSKNYGSVEACVAAMELKIDNLINVLSSDKEVADLQAKLDNELSKIKGLSELQVFRATNILASKLDLLRVFFGMSEERKKIYVLNLLMHGL